MKVGNVHGRFLQQDSTKVSDILMSLATDHDQIWPHENWPAMKLNNGLNIGSAGGHGPIGYRVTAIDPGSLIEFEFTAPKGFIGIHRFQIEYLENKQCMLWHEIHMQVKGFDAIKWAFGIKQLHDALIEDAFDKVQRNLGELVEEQSWSLWVKFLHWLLSKKQK